MNQFLLDAKIKENGFKVSSYADRLKIDKSTFYRKKNGISEFDRNEIQFMKYDLNLTDDELNSIFFTDELT